MARSSRRAWSRRSALLLWLPPSSPRVERAGELRVELRPKVGAGELQAAPPRQARRLVEDAEAVPRS